MESEMVMQATVTVVTAMIAAGMLPDKSEVLLAIVDVKTKLKED